MLNKIIQGDCLEVMKEITDKSIDMILCDLPYGTTDCKWDTVIPFKPLWEQYERIIKDNGAIVLTASQPFTSALVMSNPKIFRYEFIWEKHKPTGFQLANYRPLKKHESIIVFSKAPCAHTRRLSCVYNPQGVKACSKEVTRSFKTSKDAIVNSKNTSGKFHMSKTGYPTSILKFDTDNKDRTHPTQKPVALFEYLIKTYTNEGDTVLDNCIGSGTTAIACINTGRNFIGIEKEENYVKIANERILALKN